jgi:hypothetical protein
MTRLGEHGPDVSRGIGVHGDVAHVRPRRTRGEHRDLTDDDIDRIEHAMPADAALGDRYPAAQMGQLDSER